MRMTTSPKSSSKEKEIFATVNEKVVKMPHEANKLTRPSKAEENFKVIALLMIAAIHSMQALQWQKAEQSIKIQWMPLMDEEQCQIQCQKTANMGGSQFDEKGTLIEQLYRQITTPSTLSSLLPLSLSVCLLLLLAYNRFSPAYLSSARDNTERLSSQIDQCDRIIEISILKRNQHASPNQLRRQIDVGRGQIGLSIPAALLGRDSYVVGSDNFHPNQEEERKSIDFMSESHTLTIDHLLANHGNHTVGQAQNTSATANEAVGEEAHSAIPTLIASVVGAGDASKTNQIESGDGLHKFVTFNQRLPTIVSQKSRNEEESHNGGPTIAHSPLKLNDFSKTADSHSIDEHSAFSDDNKSLMLNSLTGGTGNINKRPLIFHNRKITIEILEEDSQNTTSNPILKVSTQTDAKLKPIIETLAEESSMNYGQNGVGILNIKNSTMQNVAMAPCAQLGSFTHSQLDVVSNSGIGQQLTIGKGQNNILHHHTHHAIGTTVSFSLEKSEHIAKNLIDIQDCDEDEKKLLQPIAAVGTAAQNYSSGIEYQLQQQCLQAGSQVNAAGGNVFIKQSMIDKDSNHNFSTMVNGAGSTMRAFFHQATQNTVAGGGGGHADKPGSHWFHEFPANTNMIIGVGSITPTAIGTAGAQESGGHLLNRNFNGTQSILGGQGMITPASGSLLHLGGRLGQFGMNFRRGMTVSPDDGGQGQSISNPSFQNQLIKPSSLGFVGGIGMSSGIGGAPSGSGGGMPPGGFYKLPILNPSSRPISTAAGGLAYRKQNTHISGTSMAQSSKFYGESEGAIYRKQIKKLETQLINTKIFLNMVIHDMRNPTNSIEFALKEVLRLLQAADYVKGGGASASLLVGERSGGNAAMKQIMSNQTPSVAGTKQLGTLGFDDEASLTFQEANGKGQLNSGNGGGSGNVGSGQFAGNHQKLPLKSLGSLGSNNKSPDIIRKRSLIGGGENGNNQGLPYLTAATTPAELGNGKSYSNPYTYNQFLHSNSQNVYQNRLFEKNALPQVEEAIDESSMGNGSSKILKQTKQTPIAMSGHNQNEQSCDSRKKSDFNVSLRMSRFKMPVSNGPFKEGGNSTEKIVLNQRIDDVEDLGCGEDCAEVGRERNNASQQSMMKDTDFGMVSERLSHPGGIRVHESKFKSNRLDIKDQFNEQVNEPFVTNPDLENLAAGGGTTTFIKRVRYRQFIEMTDVVVIQNQVFKEDQGLEGTQSHSKLRQQNTIHLDIGDLPHLQLLTDEKSNLKMTHFGDNQSNMANFMNGRQSVALNNKPLLDCSQNINRMNFSQKHQTADAMQFNKCEVHSRYDRFEKSQDRSGHIHNTSHKRESSLSHSHGQSNNLHIGANVAHSQKERRGMDEDMLHLQNDLTLPLETQVNGIMPIFKESFNDSRPGAFRGMSAEPISLNRTQDYGRGARNLEEEKSILDIVDRVKNTDLNNTGPLSRWNSGQNNTFGNHKISMDYLRPEDTLSKNSGVMVLQHNQSKDFSQKGQSLIFRPGQSQLTLKQSNGNNYHSQINGTGGALMSFQDKHQCEIWVKNSLLSSTMLLNLINDLLDLAKIENSQFNFNTTLFNLHEIVQKAVDTLEFQAQQKQIRLEYDFDEDTAGYFLEISGDDNRYLQILLNFISNSLKFTNPDGTVRIEVRLLDKQEVQNPHNSNEADKNQAIQELTGTTKGVVKKSNSMDKLPVLKGNEGYQASYRKDSSDQNLLQEGSLAGTAAKRASKRFEADTINLKKEAETEKYIKFEIRIVDNGVGISKENLGKLFMNFSKLEEHAAGNKRGTGLGLSICKSLIERMGGSVNVESEINVGTTFIMQLQTKCSYKENKTTRAWIRDFQQKLNKGAIYEEEIDQQQQFNNSVGGIDLQQQHQSMPNSLLQQHMARLAKRGLLPGGDFPQKALNQQLSSNRQKEASSIDDDRQSVTSQTNQIKRSKTLSKRHSIFHKVEQSNNQRTQEITVNKQFNQDVDQSAEGTLTKQNNPSQFYIAAARRKSVQVKGQFLSRDQNEGGKKERKKRRDSKKKKKRHEREVAVEDRESRSQESEGDSYEMEKDDIEIKASPKKAMAQQIPTQQKYKVLVANDDPFQLTVITSVLEQCNFEVSKAVNGLVALQHYYRSLSSKNSFDLIILDLDMPIMNGFEACKKIRSDDNDDQMDLKQLVQIEQRNYLKGNGGVAGGAAGAYDSVKVVEEVIMREMHEIEKKRNRILIIALSGLITDAIENKCREVGFDDFMETPITVDKVQKVIVAKLENEKLNDQEFEMVMQQHQQQIMAIQQQQIQMQQQQQQQELVGAPSGFLTFQSPNALIPSPYSPVHSQQQPQQQLINQQMAQQSQQSIPNFYQQHLTYQQAYAPNPTLFNTPGFMQYQMQQQQQQQQQPLLELNLLRDESVPNTTFQADSSLMNAKSGNTDEQVEQHSSNKNNYSNNNSGIEQRFSKIQSVQVSSMQSSVESPGPASRMHQHIFKNHNQKLKKMVTINENSEDVMSVIGASVGGGGLFVKQTLGEESCASVYQKPEEQRSGALNTLQYSQLMRNVNGNHNNTSTIE